MEQNSLAYEISAAARGCLAILTGNRETAIRYIDRSAGGAASSFIPLLLVLAIQALLVLPFPPDTVTSPAPVFVLIHWIIFHLAGFVGVYAFLRLRGQRPMLAQYIVAHNWSNFFLLILAIFLGIAGAGFIGATIITVASLVFYVYAADFLISVRGLAIVLMIGAQSLLMLIVGSALFIVGTLLPGVGFQIVG